MKKEISSKTKAFRLLIVSLLACLTFNSSCNSDPENLSEETSSVVDTSNSIEPIEVVQEELNTENNTYSYQTTFDIERGWGYQILQGTKVYINQPHIPAVSGNKGFSTEDKAAKTAEFALFKIENGIMPPTLSKSELDSLGVLE